MSADSILLNCTVFDAARAEPLRDAGVWIKAGRIAAVGPVDDVCHEAGDVERIDLQGASLIPGLVNMHTHLSDAARPLPTDIPNVTLRMAANARGALQVGVTTVRCVAEPHGVDLVLRGAIAAGREQGPRILTAGRAICCTGGHGSKSDGCLEADGADGVRQAVRSQIKLGVDLIKLMISGGIAGQHERVDTPQFTTDEMAAAISVAHQWDRKVTAHAGPGPITQEALELGLDCVEHGFNLNDGALQAMAERKTTYVPTICVTRYEGIYREAGAPEWMIERAMGAGEAHWNTLVDAIKREIPIALGTDMLPDDACDDTNATVRELEYYAAAGLSPRLVLAAATSVPAAWLGIDDEIGHIEAGKVADIVGCDGDVSTDISSLRRLRFVMKDGVVVRNSA